MAIVLTLPSLGGLELNLLKFCKYRKKKLGINTVLILANNSSAEKWAIQEDLNYFTISKPRKYFSFKQILELQTILKKQNINSVFLSTSQDLDLVAWSKFFLKKHLNIKVVFYQQMQLGVDKKNFYHRWKFAAIDQWIAPLPWLKDEVLRKSSIKEDKISLIPLCLDSQDFIQEINVYSKDQMRKKYSIPNDVILFGIIGRIDPGKGQLEVIRNFAKLVQTNKYKIPIHLCIIGSATLLDEKAKLYSENITHEIELLKLEKYITRIPHIHDPASIYTMLDILVVASQKETFGMVTVEGLLAHLIIIGAKSGGTIDLLNQGEHGILYQPEVEYDLFEKMIYVINNYSILKNKAELIQVADKYDFQRLEDFLSK